MPWFVQSSLVCDLSLRRGPRSFDPGEYSASKATGDALAKAHSNELGPKKVRVNSLSPGMVETEGVHAAGFIGTDFQKQTVASTPLGRLGQPDDIASDDAGWITGQVLLAAGGATGF